MTSSVRIFVLSTIVLLLFGCDNKSHVDPNDPDTALRLSASVPADAQQSTNLFNNPFLVLKFTKSIGYIDEEGFEITPSDNLEIDDVDILGGFDYDEYDDRTISEDRFAKTGQFPGRLRQKFIKSVELLDLKAAHEITKPSLHKSDDEVVNSILVVSLYRRDGFPLLYEVGQTYTLRIDKSAIRDIFGNSLEEDINIAYTPEPFFRVGEAWPAEGELAPHGLSSMWIYFNDQIQSIPDNALTTVPEKTFTSSLLSEATAAQFFAATPFGSGLSFNWTLSKDITSIHGAKLEEDFLSNFSVGQAQVQSIEPDPGEFVTSLTRSIIVEYNTPIKTGTMTIQPQVTGTTYLSGHSISFTTSLGLKSSSVHTVSVTGVQDLMGNPIPDTTFSFSTDAFRITSSNPVPAQFNVPRSWTISLGTNAIIDVSSLTSANISIVPALPFGRFLDYSGQSILIDPTGYFATATAYTLTVAGVKDRWGDLLQPHSLSFTTEGPRMWGVTTTSPPNGAMDVNTYEDFYFYVNDYANDTTVPNGYTITPFVDGSMQDHGDHLHFFPSTLKVGTTYTINFKSTITNQFGDPMTPYTYTFTTLPFKVTSTYPPAGATGVYRYTSVQVNFSSPVLSSTVDSAISVSPPTSGYAYSSYNSIYWNPVNQLNANTTYTLTISNRLLSTDSVAVQPYSFSFTTGN